MKVNDKGWSNWDVIPYCPHCEEKITNNPKEDIGFFRGAESFECQNCGSDVWIKVNWSIKYSTNKAATEETAD